MDDLRIGSGEEQAGIEGSRGEESGSISPKLPGVFHPF